MIQTEQFSNNHHKDLDKNSFNLDIINETKKLSLSKKLYFNKAVLPLGFIEMSINDKFKLIVTVSKRESFREEIAVYTYEVTKDGLKGTSENCIRELIYLSTWQPV